jgi:hypothetical protein
MVSTLRVQEVVRPYGVDTDVSLPGDSPDASCFGVREGKLFSV